jgi:hypothetical protein
MKHDNNKNSTIGVFETHLDAENAVKDLQKSGFKMEKLSIVGRDYHTEEDVVGYYNAGDRMKYWGKQGAFWGGIWGLLFSSAFFWIPALGPLLVAGPLVAAIVSGLEGAVVVGSLSVLGAGLYGLGIPKNNILEYETAVRAGHFILIAHGNMLEAEKARLILQETNVLGEIETYSDEYSPEMYS